VFAVRAGARRPTTLRAPRVSLSRPRSNLGALPDVNLRCSKRTPPRVAAPVGYFFCGACHSLPVVLRASRRALACRSNKGAATRAAPLARVDGLEPIMHKTPRQPGRPSFWERPSRALPDRGFRCAGDVSRPRQVGGVNELVKNPYVDANQPRANNLNMTIVKYRRHATRRAQPHRHDAARGC
jgi:hypothetical protein